MPVPVLLMAKLIALCLLLTNHVRLLPDPFLPFIPGLDHLGSPLVFQRALQGLFVVSALALLFNRSVRLSCLVLGGAMLMGVLASKIYYGNNKTFCGLMLVLAGLHTRGSRPWLLRCQVALVYFSAGLNKLLDADWQSGLFFEYWATARVKNGLYIAAARALPPLLLAKAMCWTTIAVELLLSAGLLIRRLGPGAIYLSLLFQSALLLFTGSTFTMFFYSMQAAMLVFVQWPRARWPVIYDGEGRLSRALKTGFERLDLERVFDWRSYRSGAGVRFGLREEDVRRRVYVVREGKLIAGVEAWRLILLYNPVTYLVMAAALAAPPGEAALYRRALVGGLLAAELAARWWRPR